MWLPFAFYLNVVIITVHITMMMRMMKTEDCYGDDDESSTHCANIDLHYHPHLFVLADSHLT